MHIKNIIISGFRSYREQSFSEDLSPKTNVIVGRNGAGKSNLFAAIQFVLSEKFADLRSAERQQLFHMGAGRQSLALYVEIIFDNTDGRLTIPDRGDQTEVRIRRILGLKQDEFRVNDRKFSYQEVRQLLEAAGFSAANPYYIVEQGKIVQLASMTEAERYELLKDVAGTKVYESRRTESERVLAETEGKQVKIREAVQRLAERLAELDGEQAELRDYQEADRQRKSLEYCIFRQQETEARDQLQRLESNWDARIAAAKSSNNRDGTQQSQLEADAQAADVAVRNATGSARRLEEQRRSLETEIQRLVGRRTQLELSCNDARGASDRNQAERQALEREITELEKQIKSGETTLKQKSTSLDDKQRENDKSVEELGGLERNLEVLQAKRGRRQQFRTKAERDKWIHEEISRNVALTKTNSGEVTRLEGEVQRLRSQKAETAESLGKDSGDLSENKATETLEKKRKTIVERRDKLSGERRRLWAQVSDQDNLLRSLRQQNDVARARMDRATRNDIRQGLNSLRETLVEIDDNKLAEGVHGQMLQLMSVDKLYVTAVETTVGNALFNVVVDSFAISERLLDHVNKRRKPGRVTFFPLDTTRPQNKPIPTNSECSPLVSHVKFDKKFAPMFAEMLGRTAVVRDLEVGARLVKELDCDVVTIDGDQINRKGGITGGYSHQGSTRISSFDELRSSTERLSAERSRADQYCSQVTEIEREITATVQELETLSRQEQTRRSDAEAARASHRMLEDRISRFDQQIQTVLKSIDVLRRNNAAIDVTCATLREELAGDLVTNLSPSEEREMNDLQERVVKMRNDIARQQVGISDMARDVQLLRDSVHHFRRRVADAQDRVEELRRPAAAARSSAASTTRATAGPAAFLSDLTELTGELTAVEKDLEVLRQRIKNIDQETDRLATDRQTNEERAENLRQRLMDANREQQREKDAIDAAHSERALLVQRKDDAQSKIRALGAIPHNAERFSSLSIGRLMMMLRKAHDELKKYSHVNKKALEQYTHVSEKKAEVDEQFDSLQRELESILGLMKNLDDEKEVAIERTFKQVQYEFERVFTTLANAAGAKGGLLMVRNPAAAAAESSSSSNNNKAKGIDPYIAVRIQVCFGTGQPTTELSLLSGGQKSLVALSLIFAIQRCDPAPFYLFDEIDAALDAEYRISVAKMLQRESDESQFIVATFKNELLDAADRVLGISFTNKVSRVQYITKEEGRRLLTLAQDDLNKRQREADDIDDSATIEGQ